MLLDARQAPASNLYSRTELPHDNLVALESALAHGHCLQVEGETSAAAGAAAKIAGVAFCAPGGSTSRELLPLRRRGKHRSGRGEQREKQHRVSAHRVRNKKIAADKSGTPKVEPNPKRVAPAAETADLRQSTSQGIDPSTLADIQPVLRAAWWRR